MKHFIKCCYFAAVTYTQFTGVFIQRTMAATFSRGFTKPLIFTLLGLVYFTHALLDADEAEEMKMKIETLQQQNDILKENYVSQFSRLSELMDEGVELVDCLTEYVELTDLPPGLSSFNGYMEKLRRYMRNTVDFTDSKMKEFGGKILENEEKLRKLRQFVNVIEETHSEL